ncbi:diguanylate cyclase [Thalassococcus sp. CAU 1522]|uniref:Diguanylate cyclase n=1 Tax=Thalassococcus arenae TaxID=2851652 RepID=A0ABS6N388_9RHOB|nr:diguanylate cyclase [Thalassococcus arenae]MBV2358478.1 diguanylate cyclase [Thalassococcus arenae]
MTLPMAILNDLCPMHVVIDASGHVRQTGPTLAKLVGDDPLEGTRFLERFEVYRPRSVSGMAELLAAAGRKLHLRLRDARRTAMKGVLVPDGRGGAVVKMSFGMGVVDAVRDFALTSRDFEATDLTVEMLYLVEAKSAAMEASRTLNLRLQGAKIAAEERAYTDTLTGLRNRRAADHVLAQAAASDGAFAVLHVDLDFFKDVNDTLGHAAGDRMLRQAAQVMTDLIRKGDMAARVGGDEFVILLSGLSDRGAVSSIARRLIDGIEKPVPFGGRSCTVSASIGIVVVTDPGREPAGILAEADAALYAAKRAGRGRFCFYEPGMTPLADAS